MANIYDQFHTPAQAPQQGNIYDQFHAETPAKPPVSSTSASAPAVNNPPLPRPRPDAAGPRPVEVNPFDAIDPQKAEPRELGPHSSPIPDAQPPGMDPSRPWAFTRGLATSMMQQNPQMVGEALESFGHISGKEGVDPFSTVLHSFSRDVKGWATDPGAYKTSGIEAFGPKGVKSWDDLTTYLGETAGSALGSSIATILPSLGGAAVGGRVGGRVGAVGGAAAGAFSGSFMLSQGEMYGELKNAGVKPEQAAIIALPAAAGMAALDSALPTMLVSKVLGISEVKREAARFVARRVGEEAAKGGAIESLTETAQQAIQEFTTSLATNKPLVGEDLALKLANAAAAGLVGGTALGGAGGIQSDKVTAPVAQQTVDQATQAVTGPPLQGTPLRVEAGPENLGTNIPRPAPAASEITPRVELPASPAFYSPVKRFVEEKGQNVATAEQWLNTLRNAPGVKQEELDDLGITQYLNREGKVTKADLIREIEENSIVLEEREFTDLADKTDVPEYGGWTSIPAQNTQYQDYTLPGDRDGYTELLLKLPDQNPQPPADLLQAVRDLGITKPWRDIAPIEIERMGRVAEPIADRWQTEVVNAAGGEQKNYVAPHFGKTKRGPVEALPANENLLAHARISTRKDRDGVPVALIEEIQSDWHQAGRKEGYGVKPQADDAFMDALDARIGEAVDGRMASDELIEAFNNAEGAQTVLDLAADEGIISSQEATRYMQEMVRSGKQPVPNAPFKSSWDELTFKRVLRWAVDKGYKRIAIANGREQGRRYPGLNAEQQRGMQEFYDKKMPSLMKKWAKRLGGVVTSTQFRNPTQFASNFSLERVGALWEIWNNTESSVVARFNTERQANEYFNELKQRETFAVEAPEFITIALPDSAAAMVQGGLPMYSTYTHSSVETQANTVEEKMIADVLAPAFLELLKKFNLHMRVKLVFSEGPIIVPRAAEGGRDFIARGALGMWYYDGSSHYIFVSTNPHPNTISVWGTMVHELGHAIAFEHFGRAPTEVKTAIQTAYNDWRAKVETTAPMREIMARRDNVITHVTNLRRTGPGSRLPQGREQREYWIGFDEWFAEQVARWATTDATPLTVLDKFFKGLADKLLRVWKMAFDKFNAPFQADASVAAWLNSFKGNDIAISREVMEKAQHVSREENQRFMGEQEVAEEQQPETGGAREAIDGLFGGRPPRELQEAASYADKFNKIYKWMLGLHQVAQRNPHIIPLQQYTEVIAVAQLTKQQIISRAHEVMKNWNKLGRKRGDQLTALIDDVNNMVYRTDDEVAKKVSRMPTRDEMNALIAKHKVDDQTLQVFRDIAATFQEHLVRYEATLMKEANKISDPRQRQDRIESIVLQIAALRSKPYFPAMRFGNFTITIRNDAQQVIHFETFETKRQRDRAAQEIRARYPTDTTNMQLGYLAEQAQPLMGVPTQLLEMMAEKLALSPAQRDALEQLKFELSPAQSFKHRFQHKRRIAGYSTDFRRAYANYFFHGANHLMKVMYADELRTLKEMVRRTPQQDATKRQQIANFLDDHLTNWLDPKSDWQAIRSIAFLWALAWSPAAAAQNLTQTVMTTYPFLAAKFGDPKAVGTIMRVMGEVSTFYKRGTLENLNEFDYQAITRGIQEGIITEAMAPELAAVAEGQNFKGIGGNQAQQMWTWFNERGAAMFQLAEQFNRRVVFRSALRLARANPNAKYVRDMIVKHQLKFDQLKAENWTDVDAAAYVVAVDATHETQFRYGREFAPRFMRGKARSVFVFKTFITSYMVFLANYPTAAVRSILLLAFMGGLMATPGAEDVKEIVRAIAWQMFGRDFNIEKELRKFVLEIMGNDEKGRQTADFVIHGSARRGFGLPAAMDMLGGTVGVDIPMPTFDRSRAISAGTLLPVELGKLFGPPLQDQAQVIADQTQKASGAIFGAAFNIYKAITSQRTDATDFKRWERAVPRALGSITRAYRYATEGRERTQNGATLVNYDVRDTEQLMEIIGVAAGYQPLRQALKWDIVIAQREAAKFWDIKRVGLMRQYYNASQGKDPQEIMRIQGAIKAFNTGLPPEARGKAITKEVLLKSMQARQRSNTAAENDTSVRKSDVPIMRRVQELYPESRAITRKVQ